jgi:hypothetical protein
MFVVGRQIAKSIRAVQFPVIKNVSHMVAVPPKPNCLSSDWTIVAWWRPLADWLSLGQWELIRSGWEGRRTKAWLDLSSVAPQSQKKLPNLE